jgi:hypothetical protein
MLTTLHKYCQPCLWVSWQIFLAALGGFREQPIGFRKQQRVLNSQKII